MTYVEKHLMRCCVFSSDGDTEVGGFDHLDQGEYNVSFLPVNSMLKPSDVHIMQQGVTVLSFPHNGSNPTFKCVKLEKDGRTLGWYDPNWSGLPKNEKMPDDFSFRSKNILDDSHVIKYRYQHEYTFLTETYIDLAIVKEVKCTGYPGDYTYVDKTSQSDIDAKTQDVSTVNFITLVHGEACNVNDETRILMPLGMWKIWSRGLTNLVKGLKGQRDSNSRKETWAKEQYIRFFVKDDIDRGPTPSEAIQVKLSQSILINIS